MRIEFLKLKLRRNAQLQLPFFEQRNVTTTTTQILPPLNSSRSSEPLKGSALEIHWKSNSWAETCSGITYILDR